MTATTLAPARTSAPAPRTRSGAARALGYATAATRHALGNVMFLFFTVGMPVAMYLIFAGLYGGEQARGGVTVAGVMMVTMAAYGGLGAAMNAGFAIQEEQRSGWFRQLSLTGIRPPVLVAVRIITSSLVIVPAILVLFLVGRFAEHVALPLPTFLLAGVVLWAALIPMVLIGLAIALWLPSSAGQALNTATLMVLSIVGGLWMPVDVFPHWIQEIARFTPSYWIGRLGEWAIVGDGFPTRGLVTLLVWAVVLAVLCTLGYRRGVRNSRR